MGVEWIKIILIVTVSLDGSAINPKHAKQAIKIQIDVIISCGGGVGIGTGTERLKVNKSHRNW